MDSHSGFYTHKSRTILLIAFLFKICYDIFRNSSFGGDTYDYRQPLYSVR